MNASIFDAIKAMGTNMSAVPQSPFVPLRQPIASPVFLAPQPVCNSQQKDAVVRMREQQIDEAIRFLKMQHEILMSSINSGGMASNTQSHFVASHSSLGNLVGHPSQTRPSLPIPHGLLPQLQEQGHANFLSQFELPRQGFSGSQNPGFRRNGFTPSNHSGNPTIEHLEEERKRRSSHDAETGERSAKKGKINSSYGKLALDDEAAKAIYQLRPQPGNKQESRPQACSTEIAAAHGVTAKTVRDIWTRKTWCRATRTLWTQQELDDFLGRRARRSADLDPTRAGGLPSWVAPAGPAPGDGAGADEDGDSSAAEE